VKISQKLTIGLLSIVLLLGMGGIFGLIASGKILNIYRSAEDQFGPLTSISNEIIEQVDRCETYLLRYLMLHREDLYDDYKVHYEELVKSMKHLQEFPEIDPELEALIDKMELASREFHPIAVELKKDHDKAQGAEGKEFDLEKNSVLLEEFIKKSKLIQEMSRQLIQMNIEYLKQQEAIQMASSIDEMTKRLEHHLNLCLMLARKEDLHAYNAVYESQQEILQTYRSEEAKAFAVKAQEKIANTYNLGKYLISAAQEERKIQGTFNADKYQSSIQEFYRSNKRLQKDIETLTRVNTDLLRKKHNEGINQAKMIRSSILIVTIFAFGCALFVSFKLRKAISHPISKLQETAKLYGQGKFDSVINIDSGDEIGELASAFNQMASNLRETMVSKSFVIDIIESMPETLLVLEPDLTIKMVNKATLKLLGYSENELIGVNISKVFTDDRPVEAIHSLNFAKNKSILGLDATYITKGNRKISVLFSVSALLGPQNQVQEFVCSGKDVTVQKQAENKLRQSLKQLSDIMFALDQSAILVITDDKGVITHANDLYCSLTKYTKEELIGKKNGIASLNIHSAALNKSIWETISNGEVWKGDMNNLRKDGTVYWQNNTIVPFLNETGRPFQYMSISFDITTRKTAETELIKAKVTAEEHNKAKSSFLAKMSHELRTPLNAILGYCELLEEEFEEAEMAGHKKDLGKIHGAGSHLLALINDILDLSKVEAGKMELYLEQIDISQLARDVKTTTAPLASKNRNTFKLELPDDLGVMKGDFIKLKQILINLISNACKFTKDGEISLVIEKERIEDEEYVNFIVRDTGIGIPQEKMGTIFEAFMQADSSTTRKYEGTGLGLAITSKFCELMGGRIAVTSQVGKGSSFIVKVPLEVKPLLEPVA